MKKIDTLFVLSLIAAAIYSGPGDYWWTSWGVKWVSLILIMGLWIANEIKNKLHFSLSLAFFWTLLSGVLVFATKGGMYSQQPLFDLLAYKSGTLYTSFTFIFLSCFGLIFIEKIDTIESLFANLCWADIIVTLVGYFESGFQRLTLGGVFGNPSINICFIVASLPVLLKYLDSKDSLLRNKGPFGSFEWSAVFIALTLIILAVSTTLMPILTMATIIAAYTISYYGFDFGTKATSLLISILGILLFIPNHNNTLDTHGRYRVWKMIVQYFWHHEPLYYDRLDLKMGAHVDIPPINHWIGAGNGTAQILISHIQEILGGTIGLANGDNGNNHGFFLWAHNDWVQLLFEQGIIGLLLYLVVAGFVLKKSYGRPYLFASVCGYLVMSVGNYPARMAFMAFFGFFLVIRTHRPGLQIGLKNDLSSLS